MNCTIEKSLHPHIYQEEDNLQKDFKLFVNIEG